jgi:hypothetical protein
MTPDDDKIRIEFDYAWGWFQYHAAQRLTAFNFFLVIVGFLLVGFAQAIDHDWSCFGFGIGLLGLLVAVGFLALDVRNDELVIRGENALRAVERRIDVRLADRDRDRPELEKAFGKGRLGKWLAPWWSGRPGLFTHRLWLRSIIAGVGFFFLAGAVWAFLDYPGTGSSETVACRNSTVLALHRRGFDLSLVRRSEQKGEQGGSDDDRGRPGDSLSGDLHVQSVGMGDHQRVKTRRHCGEQPVGGG